MDRSIYSKKDNMEFSDKWLPKASEIVRSFIVRKSSFEVDTERSADWSTYRIRNGPRAGQAVGEGSSRIRRPGKFWRLSHYSGVPYACQFTVRSRLDSGARTEFSKITRGGFSDLFFYGHVEQESLRHWIIGDWEVFRQYQKDVEWEDVPNDNDGGRAYNIASFPASLILDASPTMKDVMIGGIDSIRPLGGKLENKQWKILRGE